MSWTGVTAVVACELEFYLLRQVDGQLVPAGSGPVTRLNERDRIDAYGVARLDELAPVFAEVFDAARVQDLPVGTLMSEYAPGQYEITLRHRADALIAVDEAVAFKRLVKGVAARHGLIASFMAKPFTARAGSGAHLHVSLADESGVNLFAAEDPAGTPLLGQAIAGLRDTAAESLLIFAPNGNSYRRFQRESYAPVAATWGINNRSVSLRIPAGPAHSRHVEHRFCGADVNLYLAMATVLAGVERCPHRRARFSVPGRGTGGGFPQDIPRHQRAGICAVCRGGHGDRPAVVPRSGVGPMRSTGSEPFV